MAKMYEVGLKLSAALDPKLRGAFTSAQESLRALGQGMKAMQSTMSGMDAWRKLSGSVKDTKQQFGLAKQEMERLRAQMAGVEKPTKTMAHAFAAAKDRVFELGDRLRSQRTELAEMSAAMEKAGISTRNFGAEQQRLQEQMAKMTALRERMAANASAIQANDARKAALKQKALGPLAGIISPGMIGAAGVFKTMKTAASYEHELNKATAIGSLTPEERERQDKLYRELGMSTEFTTAQAAAAGVNLSRAGFKTSEIEAGLPAILNMATASDMSIDETASILADSLRGYNFKAGEMGKVADIMAKSANVANMDLRLMAETFKYAVPYANKLGVSMEELGAMTGIMADNGIKGSMAGTALREGLTRLAAPPKEAATALKKLKIQTVDADGNLLSMTTILKQLNKAMKGMGNAKQVEYMNAIFGKRGGTGMLSVINAYDNGKLQKKLKEVLDHEGYSVKAAKIMRQGLTGSWAKLTSAIEGVSLSFVTKDFSGGITGQIDDIAKKLTDLAKWLQAHPEFVTFATKFAKNFVLAKMAIFGAMYAFAQLKGVYLAVNGAVLAGRAALLLYRGGLTAVTAAYGENSTAVKVCTVAQKLWNAAVTGVNWVWQTGKMLAHKAAMLAMQGALKVVTAAQWLWNAALNANPIGLVITAVAGLAAGAVLLYNKWEPFRKWWDDLWNSAKEKAAAVWEWLKSVPEKVLAKWQAVKDWFADLIPADLGEKVAGAFSNMGEAVKGKFEQIKAGIGELIPPDVAQRLGETVIEQINLLKERFAAVKAWFADLIPADLGEKVADAFNNGITAVKDWFAKIKEWIVEIPGQFVEMIKSLPSKMGEAFEEFGRYIKGKLKEFFTFNFSFGDMGKKIGDGVSAWSKGAADPSGDFDMNVPGSAAGRKTAGPMLSLIGEGAAPEYVIPTESRYRDRALALWQQAGKDLGVPMFAQGEQLGKKRPSMGVFAAYPYNITPESFGTPIDEAIKPYYDKLSDFTHSALNECLNAWNSVQKYIIHDVANMIAYQFTFRDLINGMLGDWEGKNSIRNSIVTGVVSAGLAGALTTTERISSMSEKAASVQSDVNKNDLHFSYSPVINIYSNDEKLEERIKKVLSDDFPNFIKKVKENVFPDPRVAF